MNAFGLTNEECRILNRYGVQDLIGPAVWLASDASAYVNGQVVFVDGGMSVVV